jgi:hypothetical protein
MSDENPRSEVLARIPIPTRPEQELHIRHRTLPDKPPFLEFSQFNKQGGGYRLACSFPAEIEVVNSLIRHLHHIRDQMAQEKL